MRAAGAITAAVLVVTLALPACGGGGGDDDTIDASHTDAYVPPDGALFDAGARGGVEDFYDAVNGPCVVDDDCKNPSSDCRPIGRLQGMPKQCIPRCETQIDCPYGFACYQSDSSALGVNQMKGHCWYSLCGPNPAAMNGETNSTCTLGADVPGQPVAEQHPGRCVSLDDGNIGICDEVGTAPPGATCDFTDRTHAGQNCDATSLCIGNPMNPVGTCRQACEPSHLLDGTPTGCTLAGEQCLDRSRVATYNDGTIEKRTTGWCDAVLACKTVGANACPTDGMGMAQACAFSNPLRPTGFCSPEATGLLTAGASCPDTAPTDAEQCMGGLLCFGSPGLRKCTTLCDLGMTPVVTCGVGTTCQPFYWDDGFDDMTPSPDDNLTFGWGACQP